MANPTLLVNYDLKWRCTTLPKNLRPTLLLLKSSTYCLLNSKGKKWRLASNCMGSSIRNLIMLRCMVYIHTIEKDFSWRTDHEVIRPLSVSFKLLCKLPHPTSSNLWRSVAVIANMQSTFPSIRFRIIIKISELKIGVECNHRSQAAKN
jgi:hypothetical protein